MSDGRYSQNFHRDDSSCSGQPAHLHLHPRPSRSTHPSQAPYPHGYTLAPHSITPSAPGFPPPRVRATSMSIAQHPAHAHAHLSHHHRTPSAQVPAQHSPMSSAHRVHDTALQQRSRTPGPSSSSQYYGHTSDGQVPASPQRPFQCDMCALSFSRQHDLKRHKDTHTGERPYPCNGPCNKTFTRKDALKRHQLSKNCGTIDDN